MTEKENRLWYELSYSVLASSEEAESLFTAIHTLLCTCEHHRFKKDGCRVPVAGMAPVWGKSRLEYYPDDDAEEGILVKDLEIGS